LKCKLEEVECSKGKRETAQYMGLFGGFTVGIPLGGTYFGSMFEHAGDVRDFSGRGDIIMSSIACGPGLSWGQICLGRAGCSYGFTEQIGIDMSHDIFEGYGWVYDIQKECCNE
jgi:hypothetical protein